MWIIVEFTEEGTCQAIPQKWLLNETTAYWPSSEDKKKLASLIAKCANPKKVWEKCPARIIGKGTIYENYKEADIASEEAQYTSDFSENDFKNKNSGATSKRPIKKPSRYAEDDSSSSCSIESFNNNNFPSFNEILSGNKTSDEEADTTLTIIENITTVAKDQNTGHLERVEQTAKTPQEGRAPSVTNKIAQSACQCNGISSSSSAMRLTNIETILSKFIKEIKSLNEKMDHLMREINGMGAIATAAANDEQFANEKLLYDFPIKSLNDLETFNQMMITNSEFYAKVVEFIVKKGGCTIAENVKRSLTVVMTAEVQVQFNWEGQKGKRKFKELSLARAIYDGISRNSLLKNTTEAAVEKAVKNYLRHASDRLKVEKKKNEEDTEDSRRN